MFRTKLIKGAALLLAGALLLGGRFALATGGAPSQPDGLIRFHVLANSDSDQDQLLKHAVRDDVIAALQPILAGAATAEEAAAAIERHTAILVASPRDVVRAHGQLYAVRTEFGRFDFPARRYGNWLLPAGEYTAFRVVIGEGQGRNWWCVLFPKLCFADWTTGVVVEPESPDAKAVELRRLPNGRIEVTGTDGRAVILDPEALAKAPVKARFALLVKLRELLDSATLCRPSRIG